MASSSRAGRARSPSTGGGAQQAVEQRFGVVGDLTEPVLKDRLDVDAFFAASMRAMRVRTCSSS